MKHITLLKSAFFNSGKKAMKEDNKHYIIEQLDEALEERQNPERRQNSEQSENLAHEDRRKKDRRANSENS